MRGTLHKVTSTHSIVRTDAMEGDYDRKPTVGKVFSIIGKALVGAGVRLIETSPVKSVQEVDGKIEFTTHNSTYVLESHNGD